MFSETFNVTKDPETMYIYLDPKEQHDYTLIFLHGLGDDASGMFNIFAKEGIVPPTCRVVLQTALERPVTCSGGSIENSWFDIYSLSGKR